MTLRFEAQALADLSRLDEAFSCLDEALALIEATEEHWWEAEIHHFRGELNQQYNRQEKSEACFRRAMDIARRQESRLYELRAASAWAGFGAIRGNARRRMI